MTRRYLLVFSLLAAMLLAMSCVTSHDYNKEISCDEFSQNPTGLHDSFSLEVGDKLYVKLCSNGTTGFQWSYQMSGDNAVTEEDHDYQEPEGTLMGAAGTETWTFEAVASGSTVIFMEYSQPWEGGEKGEWTYNITVNVK